MQPAQVAGGAGVRTLAPLDQQPTVKTVHVYRNGDSFFRGRRMIIHEKRVGTFEVFLKDVTGGVQAPFGAVRNIFTPKNGHRVTALEDLQTGECYVAGGRETFKKLDYLHIGEIKKRTVDPLSQETLKNVAYRRKPPMLASLQEEIKISCRAIAVDTLVNVVHAVVHRNQVSGC